MIELSRHGIPSILLCTTAFSGWASRYAAQQGYAHLPLVEVPVRVGYADAGEMERLAEEISQGVLKWLEARGEREVQATVKAEAFDLILPANDPVAWQEFFCQREWSDGLPVIPPTPELVETFVAACGGDPNRKLAILPPRRGVTTVEKLAANAVMAGCRAEDMPLLSAVVSALGFPELNLQSLQCSTHTRSPLIMIHGPIADRLGVSATGQDRDAWRWQGNARIGRAVRFILRNLAGMEGRTTQGAVGKFADCIAELPAAESPWQEFHTTRGFTPDQSAVTVFPGEPPHLIDDQGSTSLEAMLYTFGRSMAISTNRALMGKGEQLLIIGPDHARELAARGCTREEFQRRLFEGYVADLTDVPPGHYLKEPGQGGTASGRRLPLGERPEDILVVVSGGPGHHSFYVPGYLAGRSVTVGIPEF